ncbi:MAG: hypothetical protein HZA50_18450 [Planctomycetes bacterium]|nr:hypothetical protein [Planctomycetota bacterium]
MNRPLKPGFGRIGLAVVILAGAICVTIGGIIWSGAAGMPASNPATGQASSRLGASHRIQPADLVYVGAFRLPDGAEEYAWGWSGQALAFRADGDPKGDDDGHGGSLFGSGHNHHQWISEITIPKPVVSKNKKPDDLPVAKTLQPFTDIRGNLFAEEMEQPRCGLAILTPQGEQKSAKLYFCFAQHMDEEGASPRHGWCELDMSKPNPAGLWKIGDLRNYLTCDYMCPLPKAWADANTGGCRLATGRFREGGQAGQGPALFAVAPWKEGDPPAKGAALKAVTLLRYSAVTDEQQHNMKDYQHAGEWSGAAFLAAGDKQEKSAMIFVGTKGQGKCWYGYPNGVVWPEEGPFPPEPQWPNDQRGWWSTKFTGRILFYDTADLAAVAAGKMKPHEPQPYAVMDIQDALFADPDPKGQPRRMNLVGDCAFDPQRGFLYVIEPLADGDKSIIHCWRVR